MRRKRLFGLLIVAALTILAIPLALALPGVYGDGDDKQFTPPKKTDMLAVGAAPWYDVNTIEDFSSRGPTPDDRFKPDIVGADCGETVTDEERVRDSRDSCWFSGTSQAAPHVAGLAALVRQRFPDYTPDQVPDYLKDNAEQRERPHPNNTWGHGFAMLPAIDPRDRAKEYVEEAIRTYREDPEAAKAYYQSAESVITELDLYLILLDGNTIVVNAGFPGAVGVDITGRIGTDAIGNEYGKELAAADEQGTFVDYLIPDPLDDNYRIYWKRTYAVRHDGLVFAAGSWDKDPATEASLSDPDHVVATIYKAGARLFREGPEPTFQYYNTPASIDGERYVFIAAPDGTIVADATMPELLGINIINLQASDDPELGQKIAALQEDEELWISHMWQNPESGQDERKHTYVTRFQGIIFGSGYYIFSWYDYDTDGTPGISRMEASLAVLDYLIRSLITRDEAIQVVTAYREDPLIVGHLNTVTGSLSYFGPEQNNSVELAADHVNQAGGVLGAAMIIVTGDTATNPVQGVDAARALVDVEGAVAIVGALASGVTLAVAQSVTVPKQRLLISPASTSPAITVLEDDDFLFRTTVSDAAQGVVLARLAQELGYETAGIMLINNAYGEGLADQFEETFTSLGGRVTGKVPHEDSQPTYTSELEKATEGDPDVLLAISYPGQAEVYLRESLEGGYSDTFLFVDATKSPDMMEVVGWDALEGTLGTAQGSPDSPSLREFQRSYAAVHGAPPEHPFIAENYDAAVLIALAAAKAGTTTDSVAIRDALRSIANPPGESVGPGVEGIKKALMLIDEGKDINYEGAAGAVDFDENGDVTGYIEIWKVEGGEIKSTGRFELP